MQIDIIVFIACYTERKLKTGQKNAKKKLADRGGIDWWSSGKGKEGSIGGHPVRGEGGTPLSYPSSKEHTSYLSFFLHRQNFWRIKFTPK